jgi:hypothetical protein
MQKCWILRILRGCAGIIAATPARLNSLPNLQALFINFSFAGVGTLELLIKKIFQNFYVQPFQFNLPSSSDLPSIRRSSFASGPIHLTSLTLTALPYINKALLSLIAKNLTTLTSLHLSCADCFDFTCCWDCLQDSASCAIGMFPIPDMFADVSLLAVSLLSHLTLQ